MSEEKPTPSTMHQELVIENMPSMEQIDDVSILSSSMPSRKTEKMTRLFPSNPSKFSSFNTESSLIEFLQHVLNLDSTFIARLEQVGFVTPTVIINRFGLDTKSIALSFSLMGSSHIFYPSAFNPTRNLVMFARKKFKWLFPQR